jgi:hypothetical protein
LKKCNIIRIERRGNRIASRNICYIEDGNIKKMSEVIVEVLINKLVRKPSIDIYFSSFTESMVRKYFMRSISWVVNDEINNYI